MGYADVRGTDFINNTTDNGMRDMIENLEKVSKFFKYLNRRRVLILCIAFAIELYEIFNRRSIRFDTNSERNQYVAGAFFLILDFLFLFISLYLGYTAIDQ
jgi:hypothetical protein